MVKKQCLAITRVGRKCPHRRVLFNYCIKHYESPERRKLNRKNMEENLKETKRKELIEFMDEEFPNYAE